MSSEQLGSAPIGEVAEEIPHHPLWARMALVILALVGGLGVMAGLTALREEPESAVPPEHRLSAIGFVARRMDAQTTLSGFGTARSVRTVAVSAEVSGRIERVHPRLDVGNVIPAGEELFAVDPHDYQQALDQARAEVERLSAEIGRLERQEENDRRQLEVARQMEELSRNDFERIKDLVSQGGVESQSRLDVAGLSLNRQIQEVLRLENAVALFPFQLRQARAQLQRSESQLASASRNLERSRVSMPFNARVVRQSIEADQYLVPGQQALVLADDSALEIPTSLDSRDVSGWLGLAAASADAHWFGQVPERSVEIRWTDDPNGEVHLGRLERIENFDPRTRTFTIVVRVEKSTEGQAVFPLADGMFCSLLIPGVMVKGVFVLPREVVDYDGTVLLANDGRLTSRRVNVLRYQGDLALVDEGLSEGDVVLTTRPPRVINGLAVDVELEEGPTP